MGRQRIRQRVLIVLGTAACDPEAVTYDWRDTRSSTEAQWTLQQQ